MPPVEPIASEHITSRNWPRESFSRQCKKWEFIQTNPDLILDLASWDCILRICTNFCNNIEELIWRDVMVSHHALQWFLLILRVTPNLHHLGLHNVLYEDADFPWGLPRLNSISLGRNWATEQRFNRYRPTPMPSARDLQGPSPRLRLELTGFNPTSLSEGMVIAWNPAVVLDRLTLVLDDINAPIGVDLRRWYDTLPVGRHVNLIVRGLSVTEDNLEWLCDDPLQIASRELTRKATESIEYTITAKDTSRCETAEVVWKAAANKIFNSIVWSLANNLDSPTKLSGVTVDLSPLNVFL